MSSIDPRESRAPFFLRNGLRQGEAPPDQRLLGEQVLALYDISRRVHWPAIGISILVAAVFYSHGHRVWVATWLIVGLLIAFLRYGVSYAFGLKQAGPPEPMRWIRYAVMGLLAQGVFWAALLPLGYLSPVRADADLSIFLATGLAFGSLALLGSYLPAYVAFSLPIYLGLFGTFAVQGGLLGWVTAVVIFCLGLVMLGALVTSSRTLKPALLVRKENRELTRNLSEEKYRALVTLESIADGVVTVDAAGLVTYMNPVAESLTGWSSTDAQGRELADVLNLVHEESRQPLISIVRRCLETGEAASPTRDAALLDRQGEREFSVQVSASAIRAADGQSVGAVVVMHDLTDLRRMAGAMLYQANHDPLTGLVNRREFERRLGQALRQAGDGRSNYVVGYLDLDQFKIVNDTCGHMAGDELLRQITVMFKQRIRESDTLARLGGDEFGLLLAGCPIDQAKRVAESLCASTRDFRFAWDEQVFSVGVSIGLVEVGVAGERGDVLAAADAACYVAKDQGRNRVHVFHPEDSELASRRGEMQLTSQIRSALDRNLFELRYQRILPLRGEGPAHAEILLSMYAADGTLMEPAEFLPAAEHYGMMASVDSWVLEHALHRLSEGSIEVGGRDSLAINLSGQSLSDESFADTVLRLLDRSGVDPRRLCFEITETAVIADLDRARRFLRVMSERGCRFALDDFGSGLSSFAYLRSLPVNYLKIDGTFVRNMTNDPIDRAMVEAIRQVGSVMGIETIAEFVENAATLELLRDIGIDYAQGYYLHRPEVLPTGTETRSQS